MKGAKIQMFYHNPEVCGMASRGEFETVDPPPSQLRKALARSGS
jgi:hypothetical protein